MIKNYFNRLFFATIHLFCILICFVINPALAQTIGPVSPSSTAIPSGPAGGVLSGTYPNPGYAVQPLVPANNLSDLANAGTARTNLGAAASNASITINSVVCTLSGSCTITAAATSIAVGTTTLTGGTTLRVLYDNGGVVGEYTNIQLTALINVATASLPGALPAFPNTTSTFFRGDGTYVTLNCAALASVAASCGTDATNASNIASGTLPSGRLSGAYTGVTGLGTIAGLTVTTSFTATGLVTNADLANPGLTLGSTLLTLGATTTTIAGLTLNTSAFNGTIGATTPSTGAFTAVTIGLGTDSPTLLINGGATTGLGPAIGLESGGGLTGVLATYAAWKGSGTDVGTVLTSQGAQKLYLATNGNAQAAIDASGNFGIGTTSPGALLEVDGTVRFPNLAATSTAQTGTVCWTTGTGNLTVDTTTTCLLSAARFKHNIRPLQDSLKTVLALKPVSYVYNDDLFIPGEQVGFVAEDIAAVDERLVSRFPDGSVRSVRYQQLTAELAGAIQQLTADNDALRFNLDNLRATNDNLEARLKRVETSIK